MRRLRLAALLVAAALLASCGLLEDSPRIGTAIAPFSVPDREGRPVALPTPGRTVLINYWASWCDPCAQEMPLLDSFARENASYGLQVVGIALDSPEQVEAFLAQRPVGFEILVEAPSQSDSSVALGDSRGLLPYSVLIGPDGRLLARRVGAFDGKEDLREWVATAR